MREDLSVWLASSVSGNGRPPLYQLDLEPPAPVPAFLARYATGANLNAAMAIALQRLSCRASQGAYICQCPFLGRKRTSFESHLSRHAAHYDEAARFGLA